MPKVSVITPMYNAERFIGATIESVRAETLQDWEHIIVDDGSSDGSAEVVKRYLPLEPRLKLVQQANKGMTGARNSGYRASSPTSEYLIFFDADDVMEPEMLETLACYLDTHPEVGMVHCSLRFIDAKGQFLDWEPNSQNGWVPRYIPTRFGIRILQQNVVETPFCSLYALATIISSMAMLRRTIYEATPGFDEELDYYGDTDVFLHMGLRAKVHAIAKPLFRYRIHSSQSSVSERREHNMRMMDKLYAKWSQMDGLTLQQKEMIKQAIRFRETRLLPYQGMHTGWRHLKKGQLGLTARFWGGAVKRYVKGLIFPPK